MTMGLRRNRRGTFYERWDEGSFAASSRHLQSYLYGSRKDHHRLRLLPTRHPYGEQFHGRAEYVIAAPTIRIHR